MFYTRSERKSRDAIIEELLGKFSVLSVPRLYNVEQLRFEYVHRSPASRRRRRKGNPVPGSITGPRCSVGYKCGDLALQVGGVSNLRE
jgi:hypothetical protein